MYIINDWWPSLSCAIAIIVFQYRLDSAGHWKSKILTQFLGYFVDPDTCMSCLVLVDSDTMSLRYAALHKMAHMFLIGFKLGLFHGQSRSWILWSANHVFTFLDVCDGALSYWKISHRWISIEGTIKMIVEKIDEVSIWSLLLVFFGRKWSPALLQRWSCHTSSLKVDV